MIERQEPLPERRENTQHFLRKCIILHTLLTCIKKRKLSSKLRKQSGRYFDLSEWNGARNPTIARPSILLKCVKAGFWSFYLSFANSIKSKSKREINHYIQENKRQQASGINIIISIILESAYICCFDRAITYICSCAIARLASSTLLCVKVYCFFTIVYLVQLHWFINKA